MTTHQRIALMQYEREFYHEEEPKEDTEYKYNIRVEVIK